MNEKRFSLTTSHLFLEIKEVGSIVENRIHQLNWGGCCVYAVILANELRTLLPPDSEVKVRVIERFDDETDFTPLNEVRERITSNHLDEWYNHNVHFHHVFVEIKTGGCIIHADSESSHYTTNSEKSKIVGFCKVIRPGYLEFEDAVELAQQTRWNTDFDRRQIGLLQKLVREWAMRVRSQYDMPWVQPQAAPLFKSADLEVLKKEKSENPCRNVYGTAHVSSLAEIAEDLGYSIAA